MNSGKKNILGSSLKRKLLSGGMWAFLLRGATSLCALVTNALIARLVSPDDAARYFLVFSFMSVVSMMGTGGLHVYIVKRVAAAKARGESGLIKAVSRKVFLLVLAFSSVLAVVLFAFLFGQINNSLFKFEQVGNIPILLGLWLILFSVQMVAAEYFRGEGEIRIAILFRRLAPLMLFIPVLAVSYTIGMQSIENVLEGALFAWTGSTLIVLVLWKKRVGNYAARVKTSLGRVWNQALPMGCTAVLTMLLTQIDLWIVGFFSSMNEVALYGASVKLVQFVFMPLLVINAVTPPMISELWAKKDLSRLQKVFSYSALMGGVPCLVILTIYMTLGGEILSVVYGEFYEQGGIILTILSCGYLLRSLTGASEITLMMLGLEKESMKITSLSTVVMIGSCLAAVEYYGAIGVATVVAVTMTLKELAYIIAVKQFRQLYITPVAGMGGKR